MTMRKKTKSKKLPFWDFVEKNISVKKLKTLIIIAVFGVGFGLLYFRSGGSLSADQLIMGTKSCVGKSCESPNWQDKINLTTANITKNIPSSCPLDLRFRDEVLGYFQKSAEIKSREKISKQYKKLSSNMSKIKPILMPNDQEKLFSQATSNLQKQQIIEQSFNPLFDSAAKDIVGYSAKKSDQIVNYYQKLVFETSAPGQINLNQTPFPSIDSYSGDTNKIVKTETGQYLKISLLSIISTISQDKLFVGYIQGCKPTPNSSMIKGELNSIITIKYQVTPMKKTSLGQYQEINPNKETPVITYQINKNNPTYKDVLSKPFFIQF